MILTVLPERREPSERDTTLRKHMRWALAELNISETEHRNVSCVNGCLAQNLDCALQFFSSTGYDTIIVAGARMFLSLAVLLRPCMRPQRYVVFLGHEDTFDVPQAPVPVTAVPTTMVRRWLRKLVCRRRLQPRDAARNAASRDCHIESVAIEIPSLPSCKVLVVDTTDNDARLDAWKKYLKQAIGGTNVMYEWSSTLTGFAAAQRDGARILDFLK